MDRQHRRLAGSGGRVSIEFPDWESLQHHALLPSAATRFSGRLRGPGTLSPRTRVVQGRLRMIVFLGRCPPRPGGAGRYKDLIAHEIAVAKTGFDGLVVFAPTFRSSGRRLATAHPTQGALDPHPT